MKAAIQFIAALCFALLQALPARGQFIINPYRFAAAGGGGFTDPTDIANLVLWLDADDASTLYDADTGGSLTGADGEVGRWIDKSTTGSLWIQSVASTRPLRRTAAINGNDAVDFDGSNDILNYATGLSLGSSYTMFFVVQRTTGTGYQALIKVNTNHCLYLQNSKTNFYISSSKYSTTTQSTGTTYVVGVRVTSGSIEFFLDGAADGTASGASAQTWNAIGNSGASEFFNGLMGEVVIYNAALSNSEMDDVETYLLNKW